MATVVKSWSDGSISIAVEAGKDDANREATHVHVYKNGRRTKSRIPGLCPDLDDKDADIADRLFSEHLSEIEKYYDDVKKGKYDG